MVKLVPSYSFNLKKDWKKDMRKEMSYFLSLDEVRENLDPLDIETLVSIWVREIHQSPRKIYHIVDLMLYFLYEAGIELIIDEYCYEILLEDITRSFWNIIKDNK